MTFALPAVLWLLLLVPLLAVFLVWAWRKKERLIAQFVQSRLLAQLTVGVSKTRQKVRLTLLVSAVAFAVLALARPQWGFSWEEVSQKGLDIVVAIDTSRSMLAADIPPNRLERAKLAALDLMKLAKNDRLGLVAFAGSSFLQCPLTLDDEAFRQGVAALDVNIIPQGGTAIAETIQTALAAFKEGDNHKILVLLTDGEDHEEGAVEAAKAASAKGLRIFTIGIGSAEGELIRVRDEKGKLDFLKDESGNVVKSKLNETLLQQIAGAAGGFYLNLRGANTAELLYERGLAPLPKSEFNAKLVQRHHERFYWPLGIAIVLLIVEMFLPERQKARRPAGVKAPPVLQQAATALALLLTAGLAGASSASALKNYESGKFDAALKEYDRLRQQRPEDARLAFNAGAAAYQAKQFEDATRHFSGATGARDPKLAQNAFYNLGNASFQLGDTAADAAQKREAWESAINFYDTALKLNPADADAKHNRDFVQRKLEELKQQRQDKQQDKDNQKQDDKKDDQKNDQQKKDEQKQDQSGQEKKPDDKKSDEQKQQKPDGSKQDQDKQDKQPKPDKPGDQKQPEQKKPEDQKGRQKQGQQGEQGEKDSAQSAAALGQMTPQQAMQLLDSQRNEERALIFLPTNVTQKANSRTFKNW